MLTLGPAWLCAVRPRDPQAGPACSKQTPYVPQMPAHPGPALVGVVGEPHSALGLLIPVGASQVRACRCKAPGSGVGALWGQLPAGRGLITEHLSPAGSLAVGDQMTFRKWERVPCPLSPVPVAPSSPCELTSLCLCWGFYSGDTEPLLARGFGS